MHTHPHKGQLLLLVFLGLGWFLYACEENDSDPSYTLNCGDITSGLLYYTDSLLTDNFNELARDLEPLPLATDGLGHAENLDTIVQRLNSGCTDLEAEIVCYACIETFPVQSEIKIHTDSSGIRVSRVIDMMTPGDDVMTFRTVHS